MRPSLRGSLSLQATCREGGIISFPCDWLWGSTAWTNAHRCGCGQPAADCDRCKKSSGLGSALHVGTMEEGSGTWFSV